MSQSTDLIYVFGMYGFKTSGISIVPSFFWKFSIIATMIRGIAQAVPLRVWMNSVFWVSGFEVSGLNLIFARRAW